MSDDGKHHAAALRLFRITLQMALSSLMVHKLRSFLAMLGIIIGVAATILMLALVRGAQGEVMAQIAGMGANFLVIRPGLFGAGGLVTGSQQALTLADAAAIAREVSPLQALAPIVRGSVQLRYFGRNARTLLVGTTPAYCAIRGMETERGRLFTATETASMARLAVLGSAPAQSLFGDHDPIDAQVKINGINFRVVGVLKPKGDQGWVNLDDQIVIPYPNAMKQVLGCPLLHEIQIVVAEHADMAQTIAAIRDCLRRQHRLRPDDPDDFYLRDMAEIRTVIGRVGRIFTALMGGIGAIALIIGGIGIMNIMLVNVTERIREIGIRKAIGARDRDVLRQFLIEAVVMSLCGGVVGVLVGWLGVAAVPLFLDFGPRVEGWSVVLALCSSASVGVFFGYYPARRAARLAPVEALRYE